MKYKADREHVKIYGRTIEKRGILCCAHSGTGIGFSFFGTKAVISFIGDDSTFGNDTEGKARIGIWINGKRTFDFMMEEKEMALTIWESEKAEQVEVEVRKLSEAAMSTIGIGDISVDAKAGIVPLPEKERKMEFIGDSITCGYGIDMEQVEVPFKTDTEDVTKAFAYQTAEQLNADYSIVSFSGYGIISGYSDDGEKVENKTLPQYYESVAFSYAHPFGEENLEQEPWDFNAFQPHAIVINLGTNDDSYCLDEKEKQQEFTEKYVEFLKVVRSHNPSAEIFCTVGVMGDRIYPAVEAAVASYKKHEDERIHVFSLEPQQPEDGLVSDYHPTVRTHNKVANKVVEEIKNSMGW